MPRSLAAIPLLSLWLLYPELSHAVVLEIGGTTAGGGVSSNAACSTVAVIGEGISAGIATQAGILQISGLLHAPVLHPHLDTDGDGVIDENDPDDDDDGISDWVELSGSLFDPVTPTNPLARDSDADGASDYEEVGAGTHPWDPDSLFRFVEIRRVGENTVLTWRSRAGKSYTLYRVPATAIDAQQRPYDLAQKEWIGSVVAFGGVPPWHETTSELTDPAAHANALYLIRVEP